MSDPATKTTLKKNQLKFIEEFALTGNVTISAIKAHVHRATVYDWKKNSPEFEAAFEDAEEQAADRIEDEMLRRAYHGVKEPVYQGGKKVGTITRYSDTLLIVLAKARRPSRFRENVAVTGGDGGPVEVIQRYEKTE